MIMMCSFDSLKAKGLTSRLLLASTVLEHLINGIIAKHQSASDRPGYESQRDFTCSIHD